MSYPPSNPGSPQYSPFERYSYWKYLFRKYLWPILLLLVILLLPISSLYTVQPDEVGVILRFGKYNETYYPGLHIRIPFIDEVFKVKITQIRTEEFGFRTKHSGIRTQYDPREFTEESLMLTGDLNMADVDWIVQYRVADPVLYLFKVRDKEKNLRDVSETAVREIVGDRSIDEVLTIGREEIENAVQANIQAVLNNYQIGIAITLVVLRDVTPPRQVSASFNEVNEARQEKEQMINEALAEYNKIIPHTEGEAEQIVSQARGYEVEKINTARGDIARFNFLYEEYRKAPEITRARLYLESMREVYEHAGRKVIVDEDLRSILPVLNLEKMEK